ncbi:hypothetical protein QBC46DRAFT_372609 [Diplogelasinospora grovesii]|uniref:Transmembrane protein n=1 Tax=Diplogelasinospora grovesii TaxID=303347 RepID=A0AAN6NFW9_9PEZI|nr:hypothetical protein QBC46DRAFT_372609 [Diplogelasinospora grovesii]
MDANTIGRSAMGGVHVPHVNAEGAEEVFWTAWSVISSIISFITGSVLYIVRFLWVVLWWPVSAILGILLILLSPVTYTLQFLISPVWWVVAAAPRLEPLYIFFGTAAFVGVLSGLFLSLTSLFLSSVFVNGPSSSSSSYHRPYTPTTKSSRPSDLSHHPSDDDEQRLFQSKWDDAATTSSLELDESDFNHIWGATVLTGAATITTGLAPAVTSPITEKGLPVNAGKRNRLHGMLFRETIHEEDDSE